MPYRYLEEIGTADIAFEATGRDLAELFSDAADATTNVMIDNIEAIQPRETRQIELSNDKLDMLLFDLLQELIFLKDAERLLLRMRQLEIEEKDEKLFLHGIIFISLVDLQVPDSKQQTLGVLQKNQLLQEIEQQHVEFVVREFDLPCFARLNRLDVVDHHIRRCVSSIAKQL